MRQNRGNTTVVDICGCVYVFDWREGCRNWVLKEKGNCHYFREYPEVQFILDQESYFGFSREGPDPTRIAAGHAMAFMKVGRK